MRSSTEHQWRYSDDVVAVYLAYHGDKQLGQSRRQISTTLGIKEGSMKLRVSNILGVMANIAKQSCKAREQCKNVTEPELRGMVLGILLRATDESASGKV